MTKKNAVAVDVKDKDIETVIKWKLYFDTNTGKPCGQGFGVVVAAPDESLPPYVNKPHWVEEREAVMIIKKKEQ